MQFLWLLIDLVVGLFVAGIVVPLVLAALPDPVRGPNVLLFVAVACIVIVTVFRRLVVGTPGVSPKR